MCARRVGGRAEASGDGDTVAERQEGREDGGRAQSLTPPRVCPMCQENLLLSVLPAHISMGMKLAIIERLKERGDRRYLPDNNFHSLYVKRHQNVRWAAGWAWVCSVSWAPPGSRPLALLPGGPDPSPRGDAVGREIQAPPRASGCHLFPQGVGLIRWVVGEALYPLKFPICAHTWLLGRKGSLQMILQGAQAPQKQGKPPRQVTTRCPQA